MKNNGRLKQLIAEQLKPLVRKIDCEAYYARDFLLSLGREGFFQTEGLTIQEILSREVQVVEEIAKTCMTTAFNLWCHLAALTYIRNSDNNYLKTEILPGLQSGELLGATGLSNPMKYYAGLETLHLKAEKADGGYYLSGVLPSVSNLGASHWFGVIAEINGHQRVMALVPGNAEGLKLKEKLEYLGVNGSATFSCAFNQVFISEKFIIAENADAFVAKIRPVFVLYQIPLGLGVTEASIKSIEKVCNKQGGCNKYLPIQPIELLAELQTLREAIFNLTSLTDIQNKWRELIQIRLDIALLTSKAVHACMLHQGGAGYLQNSDPSRRLREAYFLINLTPTIKHLGKMLVENTNVSASN
ncbi:acyl-CoA dehydrogenase family protein [Bacillus rubiinfantis]|uniref:acyl-CoA dehydrogenase family protein n=1 Tax=Bacillus rubiinfantis TaxID=1499680 RepID=UPI0005A668AE|nr:acyl-CoA dehydrogenase family protein [Bacillus rubiinfantis]